MAGRSSPAPLALPRVVGRRCLGPSLISCSDSANENCDGEGERGPAAASGDSNWAPTGLGKALALPEAVEVEDGRDILVWVDVELLTEWGMTSLARDQVRIYVELRNDGRNVCLAGEGSRKFLRTFLGWIFAQIWIRTFARWCNEHVRGPESGAGCFISACVQTSRMGQ